MATAIARSPIDTGVLLEAGTNEVEILVFRVGSQRCGVNVAKVREVRPVETVTRLPHYPEEVGGVVRIRDTVVPLVHLKRYLWRDEFPEDAAGTESDLLLEYNNRMVAFRVQGIERIFRVSWKDLLPLPECPGLTAPVTGVLLLEGSIVAVLDFESIGAVLGITADIRKFGASPAGKSMAKAECPLVYADDSQMIRAMLGDALRSAGYNNIRGFSDGLAAWEYLAQAAEGGSVEEIPRRVACVISDIEMPRMDGFNLTRRIREHPVLKQTPVVLFSSLISKDNQKKGEQVGATAQVSKPKWEDLTATLTEVLDELIR
jgi:two-component system, chemotaxis family, chemotaxis protein CheV